jgi:hypothetical protein
MTSRRRHDERVIGARDRFRRSLGAVIVTGVLAVGGCHRSDPPPPLPTVTQVPAVETRPTPPDMTPKAGEVFKEGAPPITTSTHAKPIDQARAMTKQEETTAMPMPGQANDHSTLATESVKR